MLITSYRRAVIRQSVADVWLTGMVPLGAESYRFNHYISTCQPQGRVTEGMRPWNYTTGCDMVSYELDANLK